MKNLFIVLAAIAICCPSCLNENKYSNAQPNTLENKLVGERFGEHEAGILLVQLTEDATAEWHNGTLTLDNISEASISPIFPVDMENDYAAKKHNLHRWFNVCFDTDMSVESMARDLASNPKVATIEYNTFVTKDASPISIECKGAIKTRSSATGLPFNDEMLDVQWNLINNGNKSISETAVEGADVGVKDAWRLTAGDPRIIVAVMDEGVKYDHEDLIDAMWVNSAELNGKAKVDDDKNGYIDDIYGYNFMNGNGELTYDTSSKGGDHGTHVAGTIAATNNNGIGVSSVAGGSGKGDGVRIMSCQIFTERGSKGARDKVAQGFYYAASMGASIVQCSYGEDGKVITGGVLMNEGYKSDDDFKKGNTVEHDALMYFLDPANANCEALESNIAVFSAGNYNTAASLYPGAMKGCVSVTATCPDFLPGGYSNYGAGCDIAAPGGDIIEGSNNAPCMILSTGCSGTDYGISDAYVYKFGTSMACPHVSGVIALGMSYALKMGKHFSREEFLSRLMTSTVDIDQYMLPGLTKLYYISTTGNYQSIDVMKKKNKMGTGQVNAWNFLMALEGTPTYLTTPEKTLVIDVAECIGQTHKNFEFTLEIDAADMNALGLSSKPEVRNGKIEITCTKTGAGKIRLCSSVGQQDKIDGLDFNQEISIVSRPSVASNGGWL